MSSSSSQKLSVSGLSNNIGAFLIRHGDTSEAVTYLNSAVEDSTCESKRAGLVWFLRKLERQSIIQETHDSDPYNEGSNSCIDHHYDDHHHHHHHHASTRHQHHHHRSSSHKRASFQQRNNSFLMRSSSSMRIMESSCGSFAGDNPFEAPPPPQPMMRRSSSIVADIIESHEPLCNENTPLGFEYFGEPVFVNKNHSKNKPNDILAAAYINLASLQYVDARSIQDLQTVLQTLQQVPITDEDNTSDEEKKYDQNSLHENDDDSSSTSTSTSSSKQTSSFILAVLHSNMAVVLARLTQPQQALLHMQKAYQYMKDDIRINKLDLQGHDHDHHEHTHDDDIYIQRLYAHVSILLNFARLCVRINDLDKTTALVEELEADSTKMPHHHHHHHQHQCHCNAILTKIRWIITTAKLYIMGMLHQRKQDLDQAIKLYREFLVKGRHELGHDHLHVATVLYFKGMVMFQQRKLHHAMLSQLAALRIHEAKHHQHYTNAIVNVDEDYGANDDEEDNVNNNNIHNSTYNRNALEEMARVIYSVARTLHDREEYRDALRMYTRALELQKSLSGDKISYDAVTTMCNLARIHHIIGDLDASLQINYKIVNHAKILTQNSTTHPFVADRLVVLGNILVEIGNMDEAVKAFADAARMTGVDDMSNFTYSPASPYDVDGKAAVSLAKAGLQHPCAAMA